MKKKERTQINDMTLEAIAKDVSAAKMRIDTLGVERYTKPNKNTRETRVLKRRIAHLLTVQTAKQLMQEKQ